MAIATEEVGVLLVHGMGEQKPLEHLRNSAMELASFLAADPESIAIHITDCVEPDRRITIDAVFRRKASGAEERTRLHLHEVFWADLGISGGMLEQAAFWLWGLGQWGAQTVVKGNPSRNTEQLMTIPRFGGEGSRPWRGRTKGLASRLMLIGAALLAILTFFTWSAGKRVVTLLSKSLPEPALIFRFLGDVKIYERPGGPGKGSMLDPNAPMRATIRRRMVSAMLDVAQQGYKRWYVFAHSLGTVPAFNALQEAELTLPNYLSQEQWDRLDEEFKTDKPFVPPGSKPSTDFMMPRRPPWLRTSDGISRIRLFRDFAGLLTFGSPLDKFAALWPRVVPLNRQAAVFPKGSEWVNLHDPTDPVAARLDAFAPPANREETGAKDRVTLQPDNYACRSSRLFGLSHIRYFRPRPRGDEVMPAQIASALVSHGRILLSDAAGKAVLPGPAAWLRSLLATAQVVLLGLALTGAAALLLVVIGKALPDRGVAMIKRILGEVAPKALDMLEGGIVSALIASAGIALWLSLAAILVSGLARFAADSATGRVLVLVLIFLACFALSFEAPSWANRL
ncbi:MAG TPA: hypothetical protein VF759_16535 [Allosphingosinicella sp.]|jgi:hypothetical protein